MTLEYGTLLINRYRIVEILGQGGMGSVYRAIDENLGISVAVKENLFLTDEYARQFRREASILASLRHPNLPRVGDHFVIQGQGQYLVMDYIEGEDLRQRMERTGVLSEEEVVQIGILTADALSYLHTRQPPIVHRDIKPGNIKITPEGQVVLVDFGLAKEMQGNQVTSTGARAMTPGYSPPEQYGTARTDPRSDVYSLGATLYAALTGAIPEDSLARATGSASLTEIRKLDSRVSRKLALVIERALSLRPEERYQTAEEFKQALLGTRNGRRNTVDRNTITPAPASSQMVGESPSAPVEQERRDLLPISKPAAQEQVKPISAPRQKERHARFPWLLFLLIVVAGGAALATLRPDLVNGWLGVPPTATATLAPPTDQPSPTTRAVVFAPSNTRAAASQPTPTLTVTPRPQATATRTSTATVQPSPTPLGGGAGLIAFVSNRSGNPQVWLMASDGSQQRALTSIQDGACQPRWSPDGLRIAFISPCKGKSTTYPGAAIYIVNLDGSELTPLTATPEGDFDPSWSPDGQTIVFTSLRDNQPQIYAIHLGDNVLTRLSSSGYAERQPVWSPDGARIAFVRERVTSQIWLMNADGSNYVQFTMSGDLVNSNPAWSPDSRLILYNQSRREQSLPWLSARRMDDIGSFTELRIPPQPDPEIGYLTLGNISPDGFWIVYENWFGPDSHDIYIMTTSGANQQRLTDSTALDFSPVFSPVQ